MNGTSVPILRAAYAFSAVRVPAAESRVVLRYRPAIFRYGVLASPTAIIAFIGSRAAIRLRPAPAHR